MKLKRGLIIAAAVAAQCAVGLAQNETPAGTPAPAPAPAAPATTADAVTSTNAPANEVMPFIAIEDAPLPDAIRTLARQAGVNIQFDPKVLAGGVAADGKTPLPPPSVTFRFDNVTAMQALQAVIDNHGLQLVQDPKTHIARVTYKDPAALEPLIPRVLTLKYSNPTNVVPVVKATFSTPRSQVLADARTGQLVVLATEKELLNIEELVKKLDMPPSQILIEARFMETTKNPRSAKGIDWTGTLNAHPVSFGNNSVYTQDLDPRADPGFGRTTHNVSSTPDSVTVTENRTADPHSGVLTSPRLIWSSSYGLGPMGFINSEGLSVLVSFLNSDNAGETIATPRAVALEGVETELSVVQNIPVFEEEQGPSTASGVAPATVKPKYDLKVGNTILNEVGTKLIVTPRVYGDSNVFLNLKPEISERGPDETTTLGSRINRAPTFVRRKIETQAMVPNGQTLVLGGLQEDRNNKTLTKVPVLGDIPGLGRAFRSDTKEKNKRQLLIFVTPTILAPGDYIPSEESRDFLKQKPLERPEAPLRPYDSAEPKDWTKPQ